MPDSRPSPRTTFKPQVVLPALAVIGALLMQRLSLDKRMKVLNRLGFVLAVAVVALGAAVLLT